MELGEIGRPPSAAQYLEEARQALGAAAAALALAQDQMRREGRSFPANLAARLTARAWQAMEQAVAVEAASAAAAEQRAVPPSVEQKDGPSKTRPDPESTS